MYKRQVLLSIGLAHIFNQVNLWELNWLWLAVFASAMGFQATFTGLCPSNLVGKLSKTGECCPAGSCSTTSQTEKAQKATSQAGCCGSDSSAKNSANDCCGSQSGVEIKVLGTGCASCDNAVKLIQSVAYQK
ncbi:hypothetical protein Tanf_00895, partial [Tannerella forsythia]